VINPFASENVVGLANNNDSFRNLLCLQNSKGNELEHYVYKWFKSLCIANLTIQAYPCDYNSRYDSVTCSSRGNQAAYWCFI